VVDSWLHQVEHLGAFCSCEGTIAAFFGEKPKIVKSNVEMLVQVLLKGRGVHEYSTYIRPIYLIQ